MSIQNYCKFLSYIYISICAWMYEYNFFYTDITRKTCLFYLHIINFNGLLINSIFSIFRNKVYLQKFLTHVNDKVVTKGVKQASSNL